MYDAIKPDGLEKYRRISVRDELALARLLLERLVEDDLERPSLEKKQVILELLERIERFVALTINSGGRLDA